MRRGARALRVSDGEETVSGGWVEKAGEILEESRVPYERSFPLSRLTTLGVGGPADFLLRPVEVPSLAQALEGFTDEGIPVVFLGAGSNLLVRDEGFRGVVVCLADLSAEPVQMDASVRAEAGMRLPALVTRLTRLGLSGLEWAEGVPGSVGGSVHMNAGAFQDSMQSHVREVTLLDRHGRVHRHKVTSADFVYRGAPFVGDQVVVDALFELTPRPTKEIEEIIRPFREHRKRTQPQGVRSSGCIWKNPPGSHAGRLIQEAGLKGSVRGGAKISEVHGNFIVNTGGATFADVMALADLIRETVLRTHSVTLEMEVVVWS